MTRNVFVLWAIWVVMAWGAVSCSTPQPLTLSTPTPLFTAAATVEPTVTLPPTVVAPPDIITHTKPHLSVNTQVLNDAGCSLYESLKGVWLCKDNNAITALGCDGIAPDKFLAGLTPSYPVMRCLNFTGRPPDKEHFRSSGQWLGAYASYILFKGGEYRLVAKESELQAVFAPIGSTDEALSYAMVVTDLVSLYKIKENQVIEGSHYFVSRIEETHVEETAQGFIVHLFTVPTPPDGCATHITSAVDVLVTKDGRVEKISTTPVYGNDVCIN